MRTKVLVLPMILAMGCGTALHGPNDTLFVDSKPSGASAAIACDGNFRTTGTTPVKLTFPRKREHCTLTVERAGSETHRVELEHGFSRLMWWNFGFAPVMIAADVSGGDFGYAALFAPVVTGLGFLIDHMTGSKHDYEPAEILIDLEGQDPAKINVRMEPGP